MAPRQQPLSVDPFVDAPTDRLRNSTTQSLRSTASAASTRPRRTDNLFAPKLSRRPNSRLNRIEDEVLADPEEQPAKRRQEEDLEFVNRGEDGNYLTRKQQRVWQRD